MNGIPKILYWIMGALLAISMAVAGSTASWFQARITALEVSGALTGERSKVSEARIQIMEQTLTRIESKLDRVLEGRNSGGR